MELFVIWIVVSGILIIIVNEAMKKDRNKDDDL